VIHFNVTLVSRAIAVRWKLSARRLWVTAPTPTATIPAPAAVVNQDAQLKYLHTEEAIQKSQESQVKRAPDF